MYLRLRKQALTGNLVLQSNAGEGWRDVRAMHPESFVTLTFHEHDEMVTRIAKYELRAKAQRDSRKNRASQPAADAASAKESEPC